MNSISNSTHFLQIHRSKFSNQKIILPFMNRFISVFVTEILYIKSDVNYCYVHLRDGRKFLIAKTLKEYNDQLDPLLFGRIHKSYIVNLSAIESCNYTGHKIRLHNGICLPIARRKRKGFFQQYAQAVALLPRLAS